MEASSLSAAGAPSTPLWTVGYTDWLGCKLWTGERNRTLLRGLCLHPTAPQLTIPTTSVQFLLIAGYSCQFLLIRRGGGYGCSLQVAYCASCEPSESEL